MGWQITINQLQRRVYDEDRIEFFNLHLKQILSCLNEGFLLRDILLGHCLIIMNGHLAI